MNTYSTKTDDRIVVSTLDRPAGDVSISDAVTVRLEYGSVRPGVNVTGELIPESALTTRFIEEIVDDDLQFRLHIDPKHGLRQWSALVCNALSNDLERVEWSGVR